MTIESNIFDVVFKSLMKRANTKTVKFLSMNSNRFKMDFPIPITLVQWATVSITDTGILDENK